MEQTNSDTNKLRSADFNRTKSNDYSGSIVSKNYSRRDFLKLVGMGAGVLTFGGLYNNLKLFSASAANPFSTVNTTSSNSTSTISAFALTVDNILLTTDQFSSVRAFGSSNSASGNYYEVRTKPGNGQLGWSGRAMTYTPKLGFTGTDSFTYRAVNGNINSSDGRVNVIVRSDVPQAPYKYKIVQRENQKTRYTAYDSRDFLSDDTQERRFQAIVESYDTSFVNQEVTAVMKMNGVSATDRIELVTRTGYPTNQYMDQRSGYVFYMTNSGSQSKRFMILNKNTYEDNSSRVTPNFSIGGSLANRTFGMKAVTYLIPDTSNIKLEFYLDLNNSGDFRLYYELVDSGQIPNARFVNPPGPTAKIRCDKISNTPVLSYFEMAEIDPQSPTGN